MTLRDAEAFFAASLAGAQRADHARVAARAGALTRGGADAATVDGSAAGDASFSAPGIVVAYARVPRDGVTSVPSSTEPGTGPGTGPGTERSAFAAIVTGGAARVSETRARRDAGSSGGGVGGDASPADDDVADADVRRAVAAIAEAFARDDDAQKKRDRTAGQGPAATGPGPATGPDLDRGRERATCAFSSRVELRRASVALSSRTPTPRRRDSRGEGVEHDVRRGVVLLDALRFVFEEERGDGARRETFGSLRCLNASAHVARPNENVSRDDAGAFPVPATARAARDAGFARVISVDKLAVDRESRAHKNRADADDARVRTRTGARVSSLRCAFRRDALDAAAALARSLVAGSPDGAASGEETRKGVAACRDLASAIAAKDPDPVRVVDRVDPDAFAFAERRAPPRAAFSASSAEPSLTVTRPGVVDDFYGTDARLSRFAKSEARREGTVEPSVESASIGASRDRRPRSTPRLDASAAPFAPRERFERRSSPKQQKKVSVVGGVTLSPAFAAEAARLERARKIPFAKPASVRAAATRTMRASSLGVSAQWSKMGDSTRSFRQKSRDFSPISAAVDSEIRSESRNENATPAARWFDGSAPAAASARRDRDATEDAVEKNAKNADNGDDAEDAFWDAFRVPAAVAGKERRTVSAVSVDVRRATLALRPGLEWRRDVDAREQKTKHASSSEAKDGDCDGVRAVFVDASARADAFSKDEDDDDDDDETTTTETTCGTTPRRLVPSPCPWETPPCSRASPRRTRPRRRCLRTTPAPEGTPASRARAARSSARDSRRR